MREEQRSDGGFRDARRETPADHHQPSIDTVREHATAEQQHGLDSLAGEEHDAKVGRFAGRLKNAERQGNRGDRGTRQRYHASREQQPELAEPKGREHQRSASITADASINTAGRGARDMTTGAPRVRRRDPTPRTGIAGSGDPRCRRTR